MENLQEYKAYITEEYNTYVTELKTGNFSQTELYAYKNRDFYCKILKGLEACEKHNEAKELMYASLRVKDFNKYEREVKKQKKIAKENLEYASEYLN